MTFIKCRRDVAQVLAVFVIDYMEKVIKVANKITFKLYVTHSTIYGVILVLS